MSGVGPGIPKGVEDSPGRLAVGDRSALSELRCDVLNSVGPDYGHGILYGIGFTEGLIDALRVVRRLQSGAAPGSGSALLTPGPALPILFDPVRGRIQTRFGGTVANSIEAEIHCSHYGPAATPSCSVTAGYAAGWYTELLGETILVCERSCRACEDKTCRFEARRLEDWEGERAIAEILPYLDIVALRERAERAISDEGEGPIEVEGELFGSFDPASPAVHVWGPLMILPYSGAEDSRAAVDTILCDVGEQLRVVVIDVAGMHIAPLEAIGVLAVIEYARAQGLEPIVAGLPADAPLPAGAALWGTLQADDIPAAIALGFQVAHPSAA